MSKPVTEDSDTEIEQLPDTSIKKLVVTGDTPIDYKAIPLFSLSGEIIKFPIIYKVYDGDTFTIIYPFPGTLTLYKWNCRIKGINAPEIRYKPTKLAAEASRNRLAEILKSTHDIVIKCYEMDKYGRVLVTIKCKDNDVGEMLINEKLAERYMPF